MFEINFQGSAINHQKRLLCIWKHCLETWNSLLAKQIIIKNSLLRRDEGNPIRRQEDSLLRKTISLIALNFQIWDNGCNILSNCLIQDMLKSAKLLLSWDFIIKEQNYLNLSESISGKQFSLTRNSYKIKKQVKWFCQHQGDHDSRHHCLSHFTCL